MQLYHNKIETYEFPDKDNIELFMNNCFLIHLRGFLGVVTNYYRNPWYSSVLFLSGICHMSFLYNGVINIVKHLIDLDQDHQEKETFTEGSTKWMAVPLVLDVCFLLANTTKEIFIPLFFIQVIMILLFVMKPFDKLTNVMIYIFLNIQNFYFCLSNTR